MTEEEQAQALARWLADPSSAPPEGVDPDVLEAIGLLRPELAPSHGVTADAIVEALDDVRVVALPNRAKWQRWMGGAGGVGVLLAAAISGVVFLPNAPWLSTQTDQVETRQLERALVDDAPSLATTTDAQVFMEGTQAVAPDPVERPTQEADADEPPTVQAVTDVADQPPAPRASPATPQPVAIAETVSLETLSPAPSERPERVGVIGSAAEMGGMSGGAAAPMRRAPTPELQAPSSVPKRSTKRGVFGRSAKQQTMADEQAAYEAPVVMSAEVEDDEAMVGDVDPLLSLRQEVVTRLGPFPARTEMASPEPTLLHEARAALEAGDANYALKACEEALAIGDGSTPERRWLALVRGDAYRALGRDADAESSYREAMSGKVR
jgi:hypothetical protein